MKVIILKGLPNSGKTTILKDFVTKLCTEFKFKELNNEKLLEELNLNEKNYDSDQEAMYTLESTKKSIYVVTVGGDTQTIIRRNISYVKETIKEYKKVDVWITALKYHKGLEENLELIRKSFENIEISSEETTVVEIDVNKKINKNATVKWKKEKYEKVTEEILNAIKKEVKI